MFGGALYFLRVQSPPARLQASDDCMQCIRQQFTGGAGDHYIVDVMITTGCIGQLYTGKICAHQLVANSRGVLLALWQNIKGILASLPRKDKLLLTAGSDGDGEEGISEIEDCVPG